MMIEWKKRYDVDNEIGRGEKNEDEMFGKITGFCVIGSMSVCAPAYACMCAIHGGSFVNKVVYAIFSMLNQNIDGLVHTNTGSGKQDSY